MSKEVNTKIIYTGRTHKEYINKDTLMGRNIII